MTNLVGQIANDWEKEHAAHAADYGDQPWGVQWGGEEQTANVCAVLKPLIAGKIVLEVGCGGGKWTKALYDRCAAGDVTAIDVHDTAIAEAGEYEPRATYMKMDGETLPDGPFDVVFSWDVYLHLPTGAVLNYLQQAHKIADLVIVQLPSLNQEAGRDYLAHHTTCKDFRKPFSLGYVQFYSDEMIRFLLQMAGFMPVYLGSPNRRDTLWLGVHESLQSS